MTTAPLQLYAALAIFCAAAGVPALAQVVPDTQTGPDPLELPQFEQEPALQFTLPPLDIPTQKQLSTSTILFVKKFLLVGNTTFSDEQLAEVTAPYEGREITTAELLAVRQDITRYYVSRGYINSGAVIPDQDVSEGTITLQIVEGRLTSTVVSGNVSLRDGFIINRLAGREGDTLNVNELRERFQILLQDPLIKSLNAELGPGVSPGEADLKITVEEDDPHHGFATINNHNAPSIGSVGGDVKLVFRSLTGLGDTLEINLDKTEGSASGSIDFALPVTSSDTFLRFSYDINDSEVVELPFKAVEIESRSKTIKISVDHPLYLTTQQRLTFGLTLEQRKAKTLLLGVPFSFSPGVIDGKSTVTALRFYQGWVDRSRNRVVAARSTFTWGLSALGGTDNVGAPDSDYFAWLGQLQVAQRLWESDSQLVFRADAQLSADQLLPIEKFSIGGANSIRGYRENQLVRDNGFVLSIEGRFPVGTLAIPGLSKGVDAGTIYLAPFVDLGRSWENKSIATPTPHNLYSAGLGVRWDISDDLQFQIYWGYAFRNIDSSDNDLQDEGIHFLLSKQVF